MPQYQIRLNSARSVQIVNTSKFCHYRKRSIIIIQFILQYGKRNIEGVYQNDHALHLRLSRGVPQAFFLIDMQRFATKNQMIVCFQTDAPTHFAEVALKLAQISQFFCKLLSVVFALSVELNIIGSETVLFSFLFRLILGDLEPYI